MNKIKVSLEGVKADQELKQRTKAYLFQEMQKRKAKPRHGFRYAFAAAACVLVLALGLGGQYLVVSPVSYISVDINPSVELSLNRLDRVIDASAYNKDGKNILKDLNLKGATYAAAINEIADKAEQQGYLKKKYSFEVSVISRDKEKLIKGIEDCSGYQKYSGTCHSISPEERSQAHEHGLSFGKYRAYQELKEYVPEITPSDCQDMSMAQIRELIEQAQGQGKDNQPLEKESGSGAGKCSGNQDKNGKQNGHNGNH